MKCGVYDCSEMWSAWLQWRVERKIMYGMYDCNEVCRVYDCTRSGRRRLMLLHIIVLWYWLYAFRSTQVWYITHRRLEVLIVYVLIAVASMYYTSTFCLFIVLALTAVGSTPHTLSRYIIYFRREYDFLFLQFFPQSDLLCLRSSRAKYNASAISYLLVCFFFHTST